MNIKNITKIITIIILIIFLLITCNIPKLFVTQKEDILPEVKLKDINKNKTFAIMVSNDTGNGYKTYNGNKWPTDAEDYYYNHSECVDNKGNIVKDAIKYNEEENKATLTSNSTIYCTLYFDKYPYMKVPTHKTEYSNGVVDVPNYMSSKVKKVEFVNYIKDGLKANEENQSWWDISDTTQGTSEGSVIAWIEPIDSSYDTLYIGSKTKIRSKSLGSAFMAAEYTAGYFASVTNLETINFNNMLDTSKTISMNRLFFSNKKLKSIEGTDNWNTSNVIYIQDAFYNCASLEDFSFLANWDVSNAISFFDLFLGCTKFDDNDLAYIENWNTSKVQIMVATFRLTSIKNTMIIQNWQTNSLNDMRDMFSGCTELINVNLGSWDTSNVADMQNIFNGCTNLQTVNLNNWNTSKVEKINNMFFNCKLLQTIDMSNATFTQIKDRTNYSGIFGGVPAEAKITVKKGQKGWIQDAGFQGTISEV